MRAGIRKGKEKALVHFCHMFAIADDLDIAVSSGALRGL